MDERWTYDQIRWSIFLGMYRARRSIIRDNRDWVDPQEDIGVAFHDDSPEEYLPIMPDLHRLMDSTIYLILSAGMSPKLGFDIHTEVIKNILANTPIDQLLADTPIDQLLADIPEDEARELRIDLEILGFIPADITKPQYG